MPRPLVTIISPTYNQERYVAGCARSALAQTYPEWEQIFVDDGSTDRTREVLAEFDDPRIRVISLPHAGLADLTRSYNAALAASTGSLVAILEGDDLWPADKLEQQVRAFDAPDTLIAFGRADMIDADDHRLGELAMVGRAAPSTRIDTRRAFHRLTRSNFLTPTVTVMVRREALDRVQGFRQTGSSMLVDLPTWLWITATQEGHVEFLNRRLGMYRIHREQTSQRRRAEMTREHIAVVRAVEAALDDEALSRIGWTEAARARAESRANLAEGEVALDAGRHDDARAAFLAVLRAGSDARDMALAVIGVASSLVRYNLVRSAFDARAWIQRQRRMRSSAPRG
jgi:glycosyltransferase involved in cell wall biosynthesis